MANSPEKINHNPPHELKSLFGKLEDACRNSDSGDFMNALSAINMCLPHPDNLEFTTQHDPVEWVEGIINKLSKIKEHPGYLEIAESQPEIAMRLETNIQVIQRRSETFKRLKATGDVFYEAHYFARD